MNNLELLLKKLKPYNKIIVVAPERSGTHICCKILSRDLKLLYIDERDYNISDARIMFKLIKKRNNFVMQSPYGMFQLYKLIAIKDLGILFIDRNNDEIYRSMKRINWTYTNRHMIDFNNIYKKELNTIKETDLVGIKKALWYKYFSHLNNCYTINYNDLSYSDLFIEKSKRTKFKADQTEL